MVGVKGVNAGVYRASSAMQDVCLEACHAKNMASYAGVLEGNMYSYWAPRTDVISLHAAVLLCM